MAARFVSVVSSFVAIVTTACDLASSSLPSCGTLVADSLGSSPDASREDVDIGILLQVHTSTPQFNVHKSDAAALDQVNGTSTSDRGNASKKDLDTTALGIAATHKEENISTARSLPGSIGEADHSMLLQQIEVAAPQKKRRAGPEVEVLARHANWLLRSFRNSSLHQVLSMVSRRLESALPPSAVSLLTLQATTASRGSIDGIDPMVFVLLGVLILFPVIVAFGCVMYVQGAGHGGKGDRSLNQSRSRYVPDMGGSQLNSSRGLQRTSSRAGSGGFPTPSRNPAPPQQGRGQPVGWVPKDAHPATSSARPSLGAAALAETNPTHSPEGVTVAMKWDIHPYRQNMDVEITSVEGMGDDEVIMCALLHEHGESCGVLLESFQGFPVAFLHTGTAVNDQGQPPPFEDRKVTVFAASSVSGISDMPVMIVFREEDPRTKQPRFIARRVVPSEADEHEGAAVFEVILDSRGQPAKVVHTDGCVVAEVAPQTSNGLSILHVTFGEDLWLGLAAIISARKLA